MSEPHLLPLMGEPPVERRDAARNREALLVAAQELIAHCGIESVTMDAVAAKAGVGKGTVFRRFESREGLMGAVLNFSETEWQASVISGPPPLGPGAPAMERLLAFGHSRMWLNLPHAQLIQAAGRERRHAVSQPSPSRRCTCATCSRSSASAATSSCWRRPCSLRSRRRPACSRPSWREGIAMERVQGAGWDDLVRRVVGAGLSCSVLVVPA